MSEVSPFKRAMRDTDIKHIGTVQSPPSHLTSSSNAASIATHPLWEACLSHLAQQLPSSLFNTWIKPLGATTADDGVSALVWVANRFKLDWIKSQYFRQIETAFAAAQGEPIRVELMITVRPTSAVARPALTAAYFSQNLATSGTPVNGPRPDHVQEQELDADRSRLNATLTFDTLVEGSANRMARTSGLHIANDIGGRYNPLFIYGDVGLGKTHLMHAIGNALLVKNPQARVLYLHAEQFVSDVVRSYQRKTFDDFKRKYHQLDLLLIDDVQFFANKERTQEEFFNAFEALLAKRSHIVLTSDRYPKDLQDISSRLLSRFDSGLTVSIDSPEFEMRVAILENKAKAEGVDMPNTVAFFIAKSVRANIRELEGALRKVLAFSRFSQRPIDMELAKEALRDLLSIQHRQISVENIQKTVADFYKIKVADMYSKKRPSSIAKPRQIAMYLAKELTQKSLPEIGELFGGRDHTTVLHAVRKITGERGLLGETHQQIRVLEQTLKG